MDKLSDKLLATLVSRQIERGEMDAVVSRYHALPTVLSPGRDGLQRALSVEDNSSAMTYMKKVYIALHPLVDVDCTGVVDLIQTVIEIKKFFVERQIAIGNITDSIVTFRAPYSGGFGYHAFIVALNDRRTCNIYQSNGCHTQLFEMTISFSSFLDKYNEILDIKRHATTFTDNELEEYPFEGISRAHELLALFNRIVLLESELYNYDIFKHILKAVIERVVDKNISDSNPILENFRPHIITLETIMFHLQEKKPSLERLKMTKSNMAK